MPFVLTPATRSACVRQLQQCYVLIDGSHAIHAPTLLYISHTHGLMPAQSLLQMAQISLQQLETVEIRNTEVRVHMHGGREYLIYT